MVVTKLAHGQFLLGAVTMDDKEIHSHFDQIVDCGFNSIELTQYAIQENWNTPFILDTASITNFEERLNLATEKGLRIVFVPRLHLDVERQANRFLWHGMILPTDHDDIRLWFDNYTKFVLKYAALCEKYNVHIFAIGSELNAMVSTLSIEEIPSLYKYYLSKNGQWRTEGALLKHKNKINPDLLSSDSIPIRDNLYSLIDSKINAHKQWAEIVTYKGQQNAIQKINERRLVITKEWEKLILRIREIYSGQLCYAANFDNYSEVAFWPLLDIMGVNAYFPLTKYNSNCFNNKCITNESIISWEKHMTGMMDFLKGNNFNVPILFTEIGYTPFKGSSYEPWKADGFSIVNGFLWDTFIDWKSQPLFEEERIAAIQSLKLVMDKLHFPLLGIMYWQVSSIEKRIKKDPFVLPLHTDNPTVESLQIFKTN